jgi:hypothetical protein
MRVAGRLSALHFLLLAVGALLTLSAWLSGGPSEILGTLPVVLLAVALACNRYPGEELIARLGKRLRRPKPRPVSIGLPAGSAAIRAPRLLLLAGVRPQRGPPLPLTHSI